MTVRSFDLLDLPMLSRYRRNIFPLYSARFLTHGNPLGARAMLSYLNPRRYLYTAVASENNDSLMGQIILKEGESSVRLTFLAPLNTLNSLTALLLDHLAAQAGEWGAFHLLAEVDENSPVFRSLRQSGFAIYAWQRVWKLPIKELQGEDGSWRKAEDIDWPAVQSLHGQIIPALIQPVDALPKKTSGLVCRPGGILQAYTSIDRGPAGIWLQPLIPPDAGCGPAQLTGLSGKTDTPVFVCVRSYQVWLENVLEDLGAEAGPRQAVMVRHLAKYLKADEKVSAMEKVLAKPVAPVARVVAGEDQQRQKPANANES